MLIRARALLWFSIDRDLYDFENIKVPSVNKVDDRIININNLSGLMYNKIARDPRITVSLKSDEKTTMKLITDIHTQLRTANALKLSYSALTKAP